MLIKESLPYSIFEIPKRKKPTQRQENALTLSQVAQFYN